MSDDTKRRGRTTFTAALLLVAVLALPAAAQGLLCGDGTLDPLEECDEGPANGAADSCCTALCTFVPADTQCRDATGECDPADVCSGTSGVCDDVKSTGVCRPAAGACDIAESCDGIASDCPADALEPDTVECRPTGGICDIAESCTGSDADCPADAKSTAVCRPSSGVCDVEETCDGVGNACPANGFEPTSVECRPSAGVCDSAEHCTGSGAACPSDAKSTTTCRPSAGSCDVAESCDGVGDACPADGFQPMSVVCRGGAGVCDVAEHCTGSTAACPSDGFEPGSVECRPAAGDCDLAESCTGSSATCPVDANQPDETPCDDANVCSINDRCIGGVCGGFLENCGNGTVEEVCAEECDDGNFDLGDGCDASCRLEPCGPAPIAGCRPPTVEGKAAVQVISRPVPDKNRLQWKYAPGAATPKADFGDPTTTTSYQFCMYEEAAGDPRLTASYAIPAGGICGTAPCWKSSKTGFKYVDKAHASQGIAQVVLKQGLADGKSKIQLLGKGANLPMPVLPLIQGPNVVLQLKASNGVCWEARYGAPAFRNQPDQFRDK